MSWVSEKSTQGNGLIWQNIGEGRGGEAQGQGKGQEWLEGSYNDVVNQL